MYYIFINVLLYQGKVINVSNEYIVCMIAILLQNYKKNPLFIHSLVCVYSHSGTRTFLCYDIYSQKKFKKQEPLEKAKLFTRFSEMELLGRFCVVFSVLSL